MRRELSETIESFNLSAADYDGSIGKLPNYDETYVAFCGLLKPKCRILDLACGPANISKRLAEINPNIKITGVDISEEMIKLARKNLPIGNFEVADILGYKAECPFDGIIMGFALPFLNEDEIEILFENCNQNLATAGMLYLSFMEGEREGYEVPSFNQSVRLYVHYHSKKMLQDQLNQKGYRIVKYWELDYKEADGSITKDIVMISQKE